MDALLKSSTKLLKYTLKFIAISFVIGIIFIVLSVIYLPKFAQHRFEHAKYINKEKLLTWNVFPCGKGYTCGVGRSEIHHFYIRIPKFSFKYIFHRIHETKDSNGALAIKKYLSGTFIYITGKKDNVSMVGIHKVSNTSMVNFTVCTKTQNQKNICQID